MERDHDELTDEQRRADFARMLRGPGSGRPPPVAAGRPASIPPAYGPRPASIPPTAHGHRPSSIPPPTHGPRTSSILPPAHPSLTPTIPPPPRAPRAESMGPAALDAQPTPTPSGARLASRRPPAVRMPPKAESPASLGPALRGWALLLVLLAAVGAGRWACAAAGERSPRGRVRGHLAAAALSPGDGGEAAFLELDRLGLGALPIVLAMLADASPIGRDGSHTTRKVRELANAYLLRVARERAAQPPPKEALTLERVLQTGDDGSEAQWTAAQEAWSDWLGRAPGAR